MLAVATNTSVAAADATSELPDLAQAGDHDYMW
jgi:hypothetical protein